METWRNMLEQEMTERGETMADVVSITLTQEQLDEEFDDGFGAANGRPFTCWTANTVYFPVRYDGSEWVGSISRNPNGKATEHIGGG